MVVVVVAAVAAAIVPVGIQSKSDVQGWLEDESMQLLG